MDQAVIDLGRRAERALEVLGWSHLSYLTRVRIDGGDGDEGRVYVLEVDTPHVQGILCAKIVEWVVDGVGFGVCVSDPGLCCWRVDDCWGHALEGRTFRHSADSGLLYPAALVDALEWLVGMGAGRAVA